MLCKISVTQLLLKALGETLLHGECAVLRAFVSRTVIVRPQSVAWNGIIFLVVRKRYFAWSFLCLLFARLLFVKYGIFLYLLSDSLFKLLNGEFDKLDGLNLQGRQFLCLLKF